MAVDFNYLREKLEEKKKNLIAELSSFAVLISKPGEEKDWEAQPDPDETDIQFEDEIADAAEELEERKAAEKVLEKELSLTEEALSRLNEGSYGKCAVCGSTIEDDRLNAEPTAATCIEHKEHR